jgi:signal peptidase I
MNTATMKKFIYPFTFILLLIIIFFFTLYKFLIRHEITYASMEPDFVPRMMCFFLPNPYDKIEDIQRGDVVLIPVCNNGVSHLMAKRIIGLPGDKIIITDSTISINDSLLKKKLYRSEGDYRYYVEKNGKAEYKVAYDLYNIKIHPSPPDTVYVLNYHVFVLNDSRKRTWNSIEESNLFSYTIVGKLWFTY